MGTAEPEITTPVDLCRSDGTLNPAAVGWTRHPLHTANLRGWGRAKRWEYWCVQAPGVVLAVTVSHIDYLALHAVYLAVLDGPGGSAGTEINESAIVPFARSPRMPTRSGAAPVCARTRSMQIDLVPTGSGVNLRARSKRISADVVIDSPPGHESLGVVIPWGADRFQYTVKDNTLPASGRILVDGRRIPLPAGQTWAVLDHGRGKWPYRNVWNWGSGSGRSNGRVVGLQLGGKWTDGTGMTENALCIDGRLSKIGADLTWEYDRTDWLAPWRVRSPDGDQVDLSLHPAHERSDRTEVGLIGIDVHQCFGTWSGRVIDDRGERIVVDGVRGFAEEARMRW